MSDETPPEDAKKTESAPVDLSGLQGLSFGPNWGSGKGSGTRSDHKSGKGKSDKGGGQGRQGSERRDRRPPKPKRTNEGGPRQGDGRSGGGPRQGGRGRQDRGPREPEFKPSVEVLFYPDDGPFETLVGALRKGMRTYELFDIANLILEKEERLTVVLKALPPEKNPDSPQKFYIVQPDMLPFLTESDAVNYVLKHQKERFFTEEIVEVDPPKGQFNFVNRCKLTGTLLGPPNYHRYQSILRDHHATHAAHMPFERYVSTKVEAIKEEEVIQEWVQSMSQIKRYRPLPPGAIQEAAPAEAPSGETAETPAAEVSQSADEAPVAETVEAEVPAADANVEAAAETEAPAAEAEAPAEAALAEETPSEEPAAEQSDTTEDAAAESAEASAPAEAKEETPVETEVLESLDAVRHYLLTKRREEILRESRQARFPGRFIGQMSGGKLRNNVDHELERQRKFPLDTANNLRARLRRMGFHVYKKGSKGISYVCAVRRRFREPDTTFADTIQKLIEFLEKQDGLRVAELSEKYLKLDEAGLATPEGEQARNQMLRDLHWLIAEGYVTEYADGRLLAPAPLPASANKEQAEDQADKPEVEEGAADAAPQEAPSSEPESTS